MSSKKDKSVTIRLESEVLSKVESLCQKVEEKLGILSESPVVDQLKIKIKTLDHMIDAQSELVTDIKKLLDMDTW